jgi:hypothetical protein
MHALKFLVASLGLSVIVPAIAEGPRTGASAQELASHTDRSVLEASPEPFRIDVVDQDNGWAVPLVTLRTTHNLAFVTDNAGLIAIDQAELMGREVFFHVDGCGYEAAKDGFGYRGVRLTPEAGGSAKIEVKRTNIAKRLGRLTGGGLLAHSARLGLEKSRTDSGVFGCDSVQRAVHGDRLFWIWGDTSLPHYPLGVFHASGATTALSSLADAAPPLRVQFDYFRDDRQRPRSVAKMPGSGPTWLSGLISLPDRDGRPQLVASYVKIKPPLEAYERGLCVWNEQLERFQQHKVVWTRSSDSPKPPSQPDGHPALWPDGHPALGDDDAGKRWVLFGNPLPTLKCPATFEAWQDPTQWVSIEPQATVTSASDGQPVKPHSGSIAWNPYRQRWVTVFMQRFGKPSAFGELWYAEADTPTGPWGPAVKVLSHQNYTFYNPRIHFESFDEESPVLLFEGTYTQLFANRPEPTPRYDYNQILYRLDLDDPALRPAGSSPEDTKQKRDVMQRIRVSDSGKHFVQDASGDRFVVWGVNYDHDASGDLLDEYWSAAWPKVVEDFREIKSLGANCVRIHLQLGQFMEEPSKPNAAALDRLAQLVRLAEETGLYLDVTGLACYHKKNIPAWYDSLSEIERWEVQAAFWEAVAETCKESPAIFCYDLMNEPILPGKEPTDEWLGGELGGKFFVQRIALDLQGRTRQQVAQSWVVKMTDAIRKHDPQHMITVGVIPWVFVFGGGKPLFHSPEVGQSLDFVAVHYYPQAGEIDKALASLSAYDVGKPILIEEMFPLKCGIDELEQFVTQSANRVDGWISFYWGATADELRSKEKPTIGEAITASWFEKFRELSEHVENQDSDRQ